jgi:hypothetical protein
MAKGKKGAKKGGGKKEVVIVASKMKDAIRGAGCNVAGDAIDFLNERVHMMITNAVSRAQENGRKTVRGYDF